MPFNQRLVPHELSPYKFFSHKEPRKVENKVIMHDAQTLEFYDQAPVALDLAHNQYIEFFYNEETKVAGFLPHAADDVTKLFFEVEMTNRSYLVVCGEFLKLCGGLFLDEVGEFSFKWNEAEGIYILTRIL